MSNGGVSLALPASPFTTGRYYRHSNLGAQTSNVLGTGTLRVSPWRLNRALNVDRVAADISVAGAAGALYRMGVYRDDGTGRPGALLLDAGTVPADAAAVAELVVALALPVGVVWIGGVVQNDAGAQPTVRVVQGVPPDINIDLGTVLPAGGVIGCGFSVAGVAGALPDPFGVPVLITATQLYPSLIVRAA